MICSAPAKCEQSEHKPSGPIETPTGSHSVSPGGTITPGMVNARFVPGSTARTSPSNGALPRLVMLTADAAGDVTSNAVTPSGHFPAAGFGSATVVSPPSSGPQFRSSAASRRSAAVAGVSSPLSPTAPFRSQTGVVVQPSG